MTCHLLVLWEQQQHLLIINMLFFCNRLMCYLWHTHEWSTTGKLINCASVQHIFLEPGAKIVNALCALFSLFQSLMCWTRDRWHKKWQAHLQCVCAACLCHDCHVHMALQSCHMLLCINHCLLKKTTKSCRATLHSVSSRDKSRQTGRASSCDCVGAEGRPACWSTLKPAKCE